MQPALVGDEHRFDRCAPADVLGTLAAAWIGAVVLVRHDRRPLLREVVQREPDDATHERAGDAGSDGHADLWPAVNSSCLGVRTSRSAATPQPRTGSACADTGSAECIR